MMLYHGTTTQRLPAILKKGILPRARSGIKTEWKECPSHDEYVYLTTAYPLYFALCAHGNCKKEKALPVVLEIDSRYIDPLCLCPDEDFVAQVLWDGKKAGKELNDPVLEQAKSLIELTQLIKPLDYHRVFKMSVETLGNCAVYDGVPAKAITRYATFDPAKVKTLAMWALDPTITTMNYLIMGKYYRSMVAHLFDGSPIIKAFPAEHQETQEKIEAVMQKEARAGIRVVDLR